MNQGLEMQKKYPRWLARVLKEAMKIRRVLLLAGPRQCGKTTLTKMLVSDEVTYRTLDDATLLEAAREDPHSFIQHKGKMLIIDEVQRAPILLPAIKKQVDEDTSPGQFLLTGSANIQSLPGVSESLAGRIRKVRLRPLTQGEILKSKPNFLVNAFEQHFEQEEVVCDRNELLHLALSGGFPEALKLDGRNRREWHRDYIAALLERDLKEIVNIRRQDAMKELINILAAWSSKFMDLSEIGSSLSIKRPTLESYISALEALYLVERVQAWTKTDYDRVGKRSKLIFTDCGLMASLLSWRFDDIKLNSDRISKLTETFVYNELAAQVDCSAGEYAIYHYRDRKQREIDFLIEREDGSLLGVEVKAASRAQVDDFKHLKWFKNNLVKERSFVGIVIYTGTATASFGNDLWAVPMSKLYS